ncbi:hypothetical protein C0993_006643 [Termitomyces sp. T159_Od127]|nr:hypothetical protein C0993_006643 [Termitomyces sp. T159_Od127]
MREHQGDMELEGRGAALDDASKGGQANDFDVEGFWVGGAKWLICIVSVQSHSEAPDGIVGAFVLVAGDVGRKARSALKMGQGGGRSPKLSRDAVGALVALVFAGVVSGLEAEVDCSEASTGAKELHGEVPLVNVGVDVA